MLAKLDIIRSPRGWKRLSSLAVTGLSDGSVVFLKFTFCQLENWQSEVKRGRQLYQTNRDRNGGGNRNVILRVSAN